MKRNIILFVAAASALLFSASCQRDIEYKFETYATFYNTSFSVPESVGELHIPVLLNNANGGEAQVSVKFTDNTAEQGVDYTIVSPANGILTFTEGVDSLDIVIEVSDSFVGEFTGAKDFSISLASATDGLVLGMFSQANVTIEDLDHPLAELVGTWAGTVLYATNPPTELPAAFTFTIDPKDDTYSKLILTGWENHPSYAGYQLPLVAVYDADASAIYVPAGQAAWGVAGYGFVFYGYDGSSAVQNLEMKYDSEAQTLTTTNMFGCYSTEGTQQGWWSLYQPGAVLTKQ